MENTYGLFVSLLLLIIFSCHKRFANLDPVAVKQDKNAKLPMRTVMAIEELKVQFSIYFVKCTNLSGMNNPLGLHNGIPASFQVVGNL